MNRRNFIHMLSAGAFGAMTLDVDKLLWVPGKKTIFLPPVKPVLSLPGLSVGDIFTIDGVFVQHPVTGQTLRYLQDFVVTDMTASSGGFMPWRADIPIGAKAHGLGI